MVDGGGAISINGAGGVSIIGTGVLSIASGGILVSGGGVAVSAGGVTISAGGLGVLGGTLAVGTLSGAGGGVNIFGSDIQMIPVGTATASIKTNLIGGYTVGGLAITDVATINGVAYPPPNTVYQATYYKTVQQNLINPDTDITFNALGTWNNVGGYITHVSGSKDFTVNIAGLYQLEFNVSINANGATWNTALNKAVSIDITRSPTAEQAVIQNNSVVANNQSYQQSVTTTYFLQVGDIINCRTTLAYATATPFVVPLQNTFDLNTFFTWRFISP